MAGELVAKTDESLTASGSAAVPSVVMAAGKKAGLRFIEFFTANIRNPNTRRAYHRACCDFFRWCELGGLALDRIGPVHVAAYIERLGKDLARPSVKQSLAAIRMLFDWLVTGQVVPVNPAHSVRGPKHVVRKGKTPVLTADEARILLDSIPIQRTDEKSGTKTPLVVGLRDRALIALMVYTFARVGAAAGMDVEDWYFQGRRWWVRLHEKGGKRHEMPAHHNLEEYMAAYLGQCRILFESGFPGVVWWACRLGLLNWNYGVVVSGGIRFRLGPDSPGVATTLGLAFGEFGLLHVIH